jgi:type VI secretion system protein ImpL
LQDFRDGSRQFNVDEFPQARTRLDALGVRQIGVHYIFEGQEAILKAAQQLDLLNRQERDSTAEKRRLQDVQFARDERVIQTRLSGAGSEPSIKVSLPKQIGVCWDAGATAHKPQNINTLFKELASARVQRSLPGVLPSGSAGKPSVHPTRKLSLSVTP